MDDQSTRRWDRDTIGLLSMGLSLGVATCFYALVIIGILWGVFVENRTSGDGPNGLVLSAIVIGPLLEAFAFACGALSWKSPAGKIGALTSGAALALYLFVWPGWLRP